MPLISKSVTNFTSTLNFRHFLYILDIFNPIHLYYLPQLFSTLPEYLRFSYQLHNICFVLLFLFFGRRGVASLISGTTEDN